jgi:hypothetical protein
VKAALINGGALDVVLAEWVSFPCDAVQIARLCSFMTLTNFTDTDRQTDRQKDFIVTYAWL